MAVSGRSGNIGDNTIWSSNISGVCVHHKHLDEKIDDVSGDIKDIRNAQLSMFYALLGIIFGTIVLSQLGTPWYVEAAAMGAVVALTVIILVLLELAYHSIKDNPISKDDRYRYKIICSRLIAILILCSVLLVLFSFVGE